MAMGELEIVEEELGFLDDIHRARDAWSAALASTEIRAIARALQEMGLGADECVRECAAITEVPATQRRLAAIKGALKSAVDEAGPGVFERFVLAHTALRYERALESAPVSPIVKRLTATGLARFADTRLTLDVASDRFVALCKMATLRRFAAGQFDWESSGLPRSWLMRVRPAAAMARLLRSIALEWRGFGPVFFVHMPVTYPVHALFEREALKAYYRMARSMEAQPRVKGLIASSWLHSPATFEVSPHLAWLNDLFAEHGAVVATMGRAAPDCGVLAQSVERQRAFDEGRFKPTLGLIVWARRDMLSWAAAHAELNR